MNKIVFLLTLVLTVSVVTVALYMWSSSNSQGSAAIAADVNPMEEESNETIIEADIEVKPVSPAVPDIQSSDLFPNNITIEEYESLLDKKGNVIVYFYNPDCSYCQEAAPLINEQSSNHNVKVYHLDVTTYPQVVKPLNLIKVPTLIAFEDGIIKKWSNGVVSNPKEGIDNVEGYKEFFEVFGSHGASGLE